MQCVCVVGANSSGECVVAELLPHVSLIMWFCAAYTAECPLTFAVHHRHLVSFTLGRVACSHPVRLLIHASKLTAKRLTLPRMLLPHVQLSVFLGACVAWREVGL